MSKKSNKKVSRRNIETKEILPGLDVRLVKRKFSNIICSPRTLNDLSFRKVEDGICKSWWAVIPPKTDYWHAHQVLGRAYAFELLDAIHNPSEEVFKHILSPTVDSMIRWAPTVSPAAASGIPHGFFEVISEYLVVGKVNR